MIFYRGKSPGVSRSYSRPLRHPLRTADVFGRFPFRLSEIKMLRPAAVTTQAPGCINRHILPKRTVLGKGVARSDTFDGCVSSFLIWQSTRSDPYYVSTSSMYHHPALQITLSRRACSAFDLQFCCVTVVETASSGPQHGPQRGPQQLSLRKVPGPHIALNV